MNYAWMHWIANPNLAVMAVVSLLMFLGFPQKIIAEDPGACFMVTSAGRTVNLHQLCGAMTPELGAFRVPIKRRIGRTPVIEVTFNDNRKFEMIFDTGASGTLITLEMASSLKLKTTGSMEAQIADGSQVKFMTSKVSSVAVGGVVVNNMEVAIAPKAGIGLLGHDFFGNYDVRILEKEVELSPR
jgi:predicted aspartyl protease